MSLRFFGIRDDGNPRRRSASSRLSSILGESLLDHKHELERRLHTEQTLQCESSLHGVPLVTLPWATPDTVGATQQRPSHGQWPKLESSMVRYFGICACVILTLLGFTVVSVMALTSRTIPLGGSPSSATLVITRLSQRIVSEPSPPYEMPVLPPRSGFPTVLAEFVSFNVSNPRAIAVEEQKLWASCMGNMMSGIHRDDMHFIGGEQWVTVMLVVSERINGDELIDVINVDNWPTVMATCIGYEFDIELEAPPFYIYNHVAIAQPSPPLLPLPPPPPTPQNPPSAQSPAQSDALVACEAVRSFPDSSLQKPSNGPHQQAAWNYGCQHAFDMLTSKESPYTLVISDLCTRMATSCCNVGTCTSSSCSGGGCCTAAISIGQIACAAYSLVYPPSPPPPSPQVSSPLPSPPPSAELHYPTSPPPTSPPPGQPPPSPPARRRLSEANVAARTKDQCEQLIVPLQCKALAEPSALAWEDNAATPRGCYKRFSKWVYNRHDPETKASVFSCSAARKCYCGEDLEDSLVKHAYALPFS